jgi:hypothetical protein
VSFSFEFVVCVENPKMILCLVMASFVWATCNGSVLRTNRNLVSCSAGTFSTLGSTPCASCPSGRYGASTGLTVCTTCSIGRYNPSTGSITSAACSNCPGGSYTASTASNVCINCPVGMYSSAGATTCTSCAGGRYTNSTGSGSCAICASGMYSTTGSSSCTFWSVQTLTISLIVYRTRINFALEVINQNPLYAFIQCNLLFAL